MEIKFKTDKGEYDLEARVMVMGQDLLVAIWGGDRPHVGAVAMAQHIHGDHLVAGRYQERRQAPPVGGGGGDAMDENDGRAVAVDDIVQKQGLLAFVHVPPSPLSVSIALPGGQPCSKRARYLIPDGALAIRTKLFERIKVDAYASNAVKLAQSGFSAPEIKETLGSKPCTIGISWVSKQEMAALSKGEV